MLIRHHFLIPSCNQTWAGKSISYFDDFPVVTPAVLAHSTMRTMTAMLDLLGFEYAKHKLQPFETSANVLGVNVDFGQTSSDRVLIGKKNQDE